MRVGGRLIRITGEHPSWGHSKGWTAAAEMRVGDDLSSHDGNGMAFDGLEDTGEYQTVYNLRVAKHWTSPRRVDTSLKVVGTVPFLGQS